MRTRLCVVAVAGLLCCSWGFLVHRTTEQLAIYQLPKKLQPFFYQNKVALVKESVQPDQRRNSDNTEAPKHFIDLEMYGDSAAWRMPQQWDDAVAKYSADSLKKYGYLPYWIVAMQQKLSNAFRSGNADSITFYAADLAHYIGDANVPLHTTVNYDGQLTAQKGLHSLWESMIPELELSDYNLNAHYRARYIGNKEEVIWQAIQRSYGLLPALFLQEREASDSFTDATKYRVQVRNGRETKSYTAAFARAYSRRLAPSINQQLLNSSRMIADFWYSAWIDAGRPDVRNFFKTPYTKTEKKELKTEINSYRNNQLLRDSLLIARQNTGRNDD